MRSGDGLQLIPYEEIIEEVRSLSNIFALYERVRTSDSNWKMDLEQVGHEA